MNEVSHVHRHMLHAVALLYVQKSHLCGASYPKRGQRYVKLFKPQWMMGKNVC